MEQKMPPQTAKFGIYLNDAEKKVVRINSPYWFPPEPQWVYLTPEVNATLLTIRQLAADQNLTADPEALTWGTIPLREPDEPQ